ncbi:hypothetical protein [Acinetobacter ursingii]|uniref:hypothetical protein n=1 Tax=Acinetobacter ursingii TaxID=108980 RepID=UPI001250C3A6|nr:hypothetical protein [Acinetobacter ursingii]
MGLLFNTDFLEQFGCFAGEESEATHYSTFGGSEWKLLVNKDQLFYWDALSKSWCRWHLTLAHCTPIGEQEPNFRCGPKKPAAQKINQNLASDRDMYYPNRGRSHIAGD